VQQLKLLRFADTPTTLHIYSSSHEVTPAAVVQAAGVVQASTGNHQYRVVQHHQLKLAPASRGIAYTFLQVQWNPVNVAQLQLPQLKALRNNLITQSPIKP
jgi:hypothetical protein